MTDTAAPTEPGRRLEYMDLDDLLARFDKRNSKAHDDAVIDASIQRFGFTDPPELDERTGLLVAGHGRLTRLAHWRDNGDASAPPEGVTVLGDGSWVVPVVRGWASADDNEAEAYLIANNRTGEAGGWHDNLVDSLAHLADTAGGLPPGFTSDDLDDLLASAGAGQLPEQPTDAAHAEDRSDRGEPAAPRVQQGIHEVGLMFQADHHAEFEQVLAGLKRRWGNLPLPMIVLRAMRQALHYDGTENGNTGEPG